MHPRRLLPLLLIATAGCGGSAPRTAPAEPIVRNARPLTAASRADERPREEPQEMHTSGLTGSLTANEVHRALIPRAQDFGACFAAPGRRLRTLGGRIELAFHVRTDGTVGSVRAVDSTVGHRTVERCVLEVAAETRFPRPHGGEADFNWPLELDPPDNVRHPITWDPSEVDRVVRRRGRRVLSECRPEGSEATIQVTTYISRRGRVLAAGAVATDDELDEPLDCVVRAVRRWRMPRHREHQAKVTFELR